MPGDGDSPPTAEVEMKLEKEVDPLPVDSTMIIRPRSALGLKYIEITPGESEEGFAAGDTIPAAQATPEPVEIDDVFNTFDVKARRGSQRSLDGFGTALAGRGDDINEAIVDLRPLLIHLQPVATNLADPDTQLARFFQALGRRPREVAPVAETQASLFVNLDTTFTALASVARPFIQESISNSPPAEDAAIRGFPQQRPFLRNSAALFRELKPGVDVLPTERADPGRRARDRHRDPRAHAGVQRAARGRLRRAQELRRGAARRAGDPASERHGRVAAGRRWSS